MGAAPAPSLGFRFGACTHQEKHSAQQQSADEDMGT
jgi:hypothetical protein